MVSKDENVDSEGSSSINYSLFFQQAPKSRCFHSQSTFYYFKVFLVLNLLCTYLQITAIIFNSICPAWVDMTQDRLIYIRMTLLHWQIELFT